MFLYLLQKSLEGRVQISSIYALPFSDSLIVLKPDVVGSPKMWN